jgi:Circularly permutated YpsA SLOG family
MLVILHSGQTGVERGAHRGAIASRLAIGGFMSLDRRDELGPVPDEVAHHLTPCLDRGPRPAVRATIKLGSGVLLVVPDAARADKFTAMAAVLQAVRSARTPLLTCDPHTNLDDVASWVRQLPETSGSTRVVVTGPRATRWPEGEAVARRITIGISA